MQYNIVEVHFNIEKFIEKRKYCNKKFQFTQKFDLHNQISKVSVFQK